MVLRHAKAGILTTYSLCLPESFNFTFHKLSFSYPLQWNAYIVSWRTWFTNLTCGTIKTILFSPRYVTLSKKTRHKSQFAIWHNAHIKVKSLFMFLTKKIKFTNEDKIKPVRDNAVLSSALLFCYYILISSVQASFPPSKVTNIPGFLTHSHICPFAADDRPSRVKHQVSICLPVGCPNVRRTMSLWLCPAQGV